MNEMDIYKSLAERNGWQFSMDNSGERPYFMKDGKYAIPDEHTSVEDKILLAEIISEGSDELKKIAIMCWDNGIVLAGPCSGIKEFHKHKPTALHVGFTASNELIEPLYQSLKEKLSFNGSCSHFIRDDNNKMRYDFNYFLNETELSKEQAESIFKVITDTLKELISLNIKSSHTM